MHPEGVEEVVADKGYHSNEVMVGLSEMEVRSYVAEPDRGTRNWDGKEAEKKAVYGILAKRSSTFSRVLLRWSAVLWLRMKVWREARDDHCGTAQNHAGGLEPDSH